jgi:hypothetical protein
VALDSRNPDVGAASLAILDKGQPR